MRIPACVLAVLLALGGCASQRPAPVEDRTATRSAPIGQLPAAPGERPEFYTVKPGETLFGIARAQGMDYRQLRALNGLDERSTPIQPGQVLRLRDAAPPQPAAAPPAEPQVEVGVAALPGQIQARELDASPAAPAADAGTPSAAPVVSLAPAGPGGPGATDAGTAAPVVEAHGPVKVEPRVYKLPYSEENVAMIRRADAPPEEPSAPVKDARPAAPAAPEEVPAAVAKNTASPDFVWPLNGRVLEKFEVKNKGIDIAAQDGDPVQAAAAGSVLYSGAGIRGYGQLLIIKHNDEFLSVYAHNNKLLVKQGDSVRQGQKIAEAGHSDSDRPKLHFEIRRQGNSVDPLQYLPQR